MMTDRLKFAVSLVAALASSAPVASAATPAIISGSIAGLVRDSTGVPQMGASVLLFNRYERLIERTITNERGLFGFESLSPDLYSVRVSLASFVPAMKQKIAVQPGMQSLLYVDLASVLSSIELVYAAPGQGALMSDDWKWTLKASSSTRPVLRFLPDNPSAPAENDRPAGQSAFSDTYGVLRVSAGDPGSLGGTSSQSDLGTAFALATSLFGRNRLQLSGNVGYSAGASLPATAFRTSFSRDGFGPEVAVTMQQVYLPGRSGQSIVPGQTEGAPAIRSISVAVHDSIALSDDLRLDYGAALDSITFLDHLKCSQRGFAVDRTNCARLHRWDFVLFGSEFYFRMGCMSADLSEEFPAKGGKKPGFDSLGISDLFLVFSQDEESFLGEIRSFVLVFRQG